MTLEALHQIARDYISTGYHFEVEPYTMDSEEVRAYYRKEGGGNPVGYHLDVQPKGTEMIETIFIRIDMQPPVVKQVISLALQRLQRQQQQHSVTPYLLIVR